MRFDRAIHSVRRKIILKHLYDYAIKRAYCWHEINHHYSGNGISIH